MKKEDNFTPACIPKLKVVIPDKYNEEISVGDYSPIDIHRIGLMIATPEQFYASFFERKDYCIQYVIKGEGDFFVNNRLYKLKKNTLFLLPKRNYHYYTANKENPYEYLWIHFSGKGFEEFLRKIGLSEENPILFDVINPNIEKVFFELIELSKNKTENNELLILAKGYQLLHEISTCCSENHLMREQESNPLIDSIIAYINENYRENLTLDFLASKFFINKYYLIKQFKKYTTMTPIQYLIQYRISIASYLLRTSSMTIAEVSEQSGFHSPTNFLLRFKKAIGFSPSEHKKNVTKHENS